MTMRQNMIPGTAERMALENLSFYEYSKGFNFIRA